jgi:hypothetical protein
MGYDANVGYAAGAMFDIAKGLLPVALAALLARRALGIAAILGAAWICLVVFSCLATHATITTAISAIERTGTWKMEVRGNTKAALASVEQQLAALSRPSPPRPAKTVQEALAAERVPPNVRPPELLGRRRVGKASKSRGASGSCTGKDGSSAIGGWANHGDSENDCSGVVAAARDWPCPNCNCPYSPMASLTSPANWPS